ncbi:MAG: homoserine dehydrogenase [Anaerolineales bacterium]|nr:homoserine dehydrogenase [Anaerolineales bacterium]
MKTYKLALLGFGHVGQAFARLLMRKADQLADEYRIQPVVTAIATGSRGRAIDPNGIDLWAALNLIESGQMLDNLSAEPAPEDNIAFIQASGADVLFENTPVSYLDGQPAIDHIRAALEMGMHAVTANKGPVVYGYHTLTALAAQKGVRFLFESTVMDGAPVFGMTRETIPAANIHRIEGVLNSTTNLILTHMENGESFDEAVRYAQSIGIAETDPSGDVDGWDSAIKISALITVLMKTPFTPDKVNRDGIKEITPEKIAAAKAEGKRWKLICTAEKRADGIEAKVAPAMVGPDTPAYTIDGTTSIVTLESDVLGTLSLIEADPSPITTAYGLLADLINAVKGRSAKG